VIDDNHINHIVVIALTANYLRAAALPAAA
jgi:hypothetical protein